MSTRAWNPDDDPAAEQPKLGRTLSAVPALTGQRDRPGEIRLAVVEPADLDVALPTDLVAQLEDRGRVVGMRAAMGGQDQRWKAHP